MMHGSRVSSILNRLEVRVSRDCGVGVKISVHTFCYIRIVPDMHTRKVR